MRLVHINRVNIFQSWGPLLCENMQNKCVFHIYLQLNVTDDSDSPQDMIAHFCQFRKFYLTPVGTLTKNNRIIRCSA